MDDVVIAGAGPAGSVAAVLLARAGLRVRLLDRARFPRHKLCGDTINPGALAVFERLGLGSVVADASPVEGMLVTGSTGVPIVGRYGPAVHGCSLSRARLDHALVEAAVAAGAALDEGVAVRAPLFSNERVAGVTVARSGACATSIPARLVVAADGTSSRLARALGLLAHPVRPRRWAVGAYFSDVDGLSTLGEMHIREGRYIGVAPLPQAVTNVCVVSSDPHVIRRAARSVRDIVRDDRRLCDRFARARQVSRPVCLGPLAVDASACGVPGCVLAGDAAGFIDPMTGDGLRLAMRGAELAAAAILDELLGRAVQAHERLARARRREFSRKWRFNRTLRTLVTSPRAIRAAARGAALVPASVQLAIRYAGDLQAT